MKKLLLSSIIMFGVCGFVTAQNATEGQSKKANKSTIASPAAPTPQKSAFATTAPADVINADGTVAAKSADAPAIASDKVQTTSDDMKAPVAGDNVDYQKKNAARKAEAAKAAADKKNN